METAADAIFHVHEKVQNEAPSLPLSHCLDRQDCDVVEEHPNLCINFEVPGTINGIACELPLPFRPF